MNNLKLKIDKALEEAKFIFAKKMPEIPHEYTTVKKWEDQDFYNNVCNHITAYGIRQKFGKSYYKYYYANGYKYWLMRDMYAKGFYIINRAKDDKANIE
jgi:hypothetical protein